MKQTAIINGKILDRDTNTQKILNIVIGNQKIIGLGYIPDDEDGNIIDISNSYIIPHLLQDSHIEGAIPLETLKTDLALQNALPTLIQEERIPIVTCKSENTQSCLDFCFNDLLKHISIETVLKLLTPQKKFQTKPYLGLLSRPNFYVLKPNTTPCLVLEVKDGALIQSTPNT